MAGIVDYLLDLIVPEYKYYGGPGNSGDEEVWDPFAVLSANKERDFAAVPFDKLDLCFFFHDMRYELALRSGNNITDYKRADCQLLIALANLKDSDLNNDINAIDYRDKAIALFKAKNIFNIAFETVDAFVTFIKSNTLDVLTELLQEPSNPTPVIINSAAENWYEMRYWMNEYARDYLAAIEMYLQSEQFKPDITDELDAKDMMRMYTVHQTLTAKGVKSLHGSLEA